MKLSEAIEAGLAGLGKIDAVTRVIDPAVREVTSDMAAAFVHSGAEKPEDYFTDDPETNRTIMAGVALANEINSSIDWSAVPGAVLSSAWTALKAASAIAARSPVRRPRWP